MTAVATTCPWNADARSRAQTRGLLMALARDRASPGTKRSEALPVYLATFGLLPFVERSRLFLSLERYEWSLLSELTAWLFKFTPLADGAVELGTWANLWLKSARSRWQIELCAAGVLLPIVLIFFNSISWHGHHPSGRAIHLISDGWRLFVLYIAVVWWLHLVLVLLHRRRLNRWVRLLNNVLQGDEKRPMTLLPGWWLALGAVTLIIALGQALTPWPIALLAIALTRLTIAAHLRELRRLHLQMIERLLEWMDDSELPVEFDVVALNPDEIAAMIAR